MAVKTHQEPSAPLHPLRDIGRPVPEGSLSWVVRYPGPCGIRDYFAGRLKTPASPDDRLCQFRLRPYPDFETGIRRFGFLAFTRPEKYQLVESDAGIFWGLNTPTPAHEILWIPPLLADRALGMGDALLRLPLSDWITDEDLRGFREAAIQTRGEIAGHFSELDRLQFPHPRHEHLGRSTPHPRQI
jgi:hypothetical protein